MILSGKLFPAAFVEVMLPQGKVYFQAIKKPNMPFQLFLCNNFNYICTSTNYIKSYLAQRGVPWQLSYCFYSYFFQPANAATQAVSLFTIISLHAVVACRKCGCALRIYDVSQNLPHLSVVHCFSNITLHLFRRLPLQHV